MTPSGAEAERRRAARAGRRMLERALPPGFVRWIERLADSQGTPEEIHAWAGALAAIATELERAFLKSGTEVRDRILNLHSLLSEGEATLEAPGGKELEPFLPWLRSQLKASKGTPSARIVLMQWIDVASERLTLRRYHRPDLPAHHARTLIVVPAEAIGIDWVNAGDDPRSERNPQGSDVAETALALLRFVDLLDAERLSQQGKNRISAPDSEKFGGFFGVSENVQPPSAEELEAELGDLRERAVSLLEKPGLPSALKVIVEEMRQALEDRARHGQWPDDYRWKSPGERRRPASLLRRLFGTR